MVKLCVNVGSLHDNLTPTSKQFKRKFDFDFDFDFDFGMFKFYVNIIKILTHIKTVRKYQKNWEIALNSVWPF